MYLFWRRNSNSGFQYLQNSPSTLFGARKVAGERKGKEKQYEILSSITVSFYIQFIQS